jgi:1-acyl-sn-glycerol-3-phosphate acyltransferase
MLERLTAAQENFRTAVRQNQYRQVFPVLKLPVSKAECVFLTLRRRRRQLTLHLPTQREDTAAALRYQYHPNQGYPAESFSKIREHTHHPYRYLSLKSTKSPNPQIGVILSNVSQSVNFQCSIGDEMFQQCWYQVGRSIVKFYVHQVLHVNIALETELPAGAKILAANHPSTSDPAFITVLVDEQASILIKETLFKVPLFGRSLRLAGHVPVVRGNGQAALDEGLRLLKKGRTIIIFPEGEISPESGLHKAHTGVARLALASGAPVIPVGISLDHKQLRFVPTRVEDKDEPSAWYLKGPYALTVGSAQRYHGDAADRDLVHQVTEKVMRQISQLQTIGQRRMEIAQRQALLRAAQASAITRAARWAKYSVAFRAIQSMLFFLIGTAGRV